METKALDIDIIPISSDSGLKQAFTIRRQVFCIEQNVSEEIEMDEFDNKSHHILAMIKDIPVATARWRFTREGAKLKRFAVLKKYRGKSVGAALVVYILNELHGHNRIYLNAQESVIDFYQKFGFVVVGPRFYEANIPHKKMVLK